jgi:hypothetical protein
MLGSSECRRPLHINAKILRQHCKKQQKDTVSATTKLLATDLQVEKVEQKLMHLNRHYSHLRRSSSLNGPCQRSLAMDSHSRIKLFSLMPVLYIATGSLTLPI